MRPLALLASTLLLAAPALAQTPDASRCTNLRQLPLDQAHIVSAEVVATGTFVAPPRPTGPGEQVALYKRLPAFCRVKIEATPTPDSKIQIEVWLPVADWNHRFQGIGNGGFAGEIDFHGLARALDNNTATAGTDTGHFADGIDASWALHHPEKITDFGWRGIHQMTEQAKAVVAAYYGAPAQHSYFTACSDGGREALMEAQRFPADYDGILAGAPAYNWTTLITSGAIGMQTLLSDDASYIPATDVPLIHRAIVRQCDKVDGLKDSLIADPPACHFAAATLACKTGHMQRCLTAAQVKSLNTLLSERRVSDTTIFPVLPAGGELDPNGWPSWIMGQERGKSAMSGFGYGYFANMVYDNPKWDFHTFDPVAGLAAAREKTSEALDATNPDLSAFRNRSGKLILYHGWADAAISPFYSIHYYEEVQQKLGKDETASFTRLYLMPGVKHCAGGPGPNAIGQFGLPGMKESNAGNNVIHALEDWVEAGKAPAAITATKYAELPADPRHAPQADPPKIEMTRPVCPYPQQAHYKGTGSTKNAASFTCQAGPGK
ncbi:MAG TPA: tannase/feruloyl esterase family alpha/beta hydrolase [Acidobacteriaceae bacterium]|nr:tannase/feruloyl esterase family alpha/beta hydrolase [Acidobacteriaceae bacterium]